MFKGLWIALLSLAHTLTMMIKASLFFLFIGAFFLKSSAQDTLLMLSGKTLPGKILDESGAYVLLEVPKNNGKTKVLSYDKAEIFSFKKGEKDSILYQMDPVFGEDLTQVEMRMFMHGQEDARNGHPMRYNQLGGFALGLGTTLALDGGALPFLTPFVYSLTMQIPVVKVKEAAIHDQRNTLSPYYLEGYNATARSKKFVRGFLSTMAGVFLGSGIILLTD
jgi:hypothetical protein